MATANPIDEYIGGFVDAGVVQVGAPAVDAAFGDLGGIGIGGDDGRKSGV